MLAVGISVILGTSAAVADEVEFNRDIRPILRETCFRCHGPDSASRKADLRLDKREEAIKAGAITPGKLDESEMIARILSDDPEEIMPPPASHKVLNAAQKELFKKWVASGAEYQPHWAYVVPRRPAVPRRTVISPRMRSVPRRLPPPCAAAFSRRSCVSAFQSSDQA